MSTKKWVRCLDTTLKVRCTERYSTSSVMAETQTKTVEMALDPPGLCTVKRLSLPRPGRRWWVWKSRTSLPGEDGNPHSRFCKLWLQKVKASPAVGPSRSALRCSGPEHSGRPARTLVGVFIDEYSQSIQIVKRTQSSLGGREKIVVSLFKGLLRRKKKE